jgi:hypothetical protein
VAEVAEVAETVICSSACCRDAAGVAKGATT